MPKTREEKCTVFAKTVMPHGKHYRVGCYESVWLLWEAGKEGGSKSAIERTAEAD